MRLYYLLEGENEIPLYREWTKYLNRHMKPIEVVNELGGCKYYIFSSKGYPHIYDDIERACIDCERYNYDYLFICMDQDENSKERIEEEVMKRVGKRKIKYRIILQSKCIETWLMANKKVYKKRPDKNGCFWKYHIKYDASRNDPEAMPSYEQNLTTSQYHYKYYRAMMSERRIVYGKGQTNDKVLTKDYFGELRKRVTRSDHIDSFKKYLQAIRDTIGLA